jgi:hypothetical protein
MHCLCEVHRVTPNLLHGSVGEGRPRCASLELVPIPTNECWQGLAGIGPELLGEVPSASNAPEKRDNTVTCGQRAVDIEGRSLSAGGNYVKRIPKRRPTL